MEEREGHSWMDVVSHYAGSTLAGAGGQATKRRLTVEVRPKSKERPRMSKSGHVYTPSATKEYETLIRDEWLLQTIGRPPLTGALMVVAVFTFRRPKSHYKSDGTLKASAPEHFTQVPDLDNIEKAVLDALNKVAYTDDKLITDKLSMKRWGTEDLVEVEVMEYGTDL